MRARDGRRRARASLDDDDVDDDDDDRRGRRASSSSRARRRRRRRRARRRASAAVAPRPPETSNAVDGAVFNLHFTRQRYERIVFVSYVDSYPHVQRIQVSIRLLFTLES